MTNGLSLRVLWRILKFCRIFVFQGYRDAQCGWLHVPMEFLDNRGAGQESIPCSLDLGPSRGTEGRGQREDTEGSGSSGRQEMLLAIYAPRRQLVELWRPRQGVRVLALARVGAHCQLLETFELQGSSPDAPQAEGAGQRAQASWPPTSANQHVGESDLSWHFDNDEEHCESGDNSGKDQHPTGQHRSDHNDLLTQRSCISKSRSCCFLVDGAQGTITDLRSCLNDQRPKSGRGGSCP